MSNDRPANDNRSLGERAALFMRLFGGTDGSGKPRHANNNQNPPPQGWNR
jgi:hypothetical protein